MLKISSGLVCDVARSAWGSDRWKVEEKGTMVHESYSTGMLTYLMVMTVTFISYSQNSV